MAEDLTNRGAQVAVPGGAEGMAAIDGQFEAHIGPTERVGVDGAADEGRFGRDRAEKLQARGHMLEEVAHRDGRPLRAAARPLRDRPATIDLHLEALVAAERAGEEREARDGGDAGERLAAEAERGDVLQIRERADFARRVRLDSEAHIVRRHADAVVRDADEVAPALANLDAHRAAPPHRGRSRPIP